MPLPFRATAWNLFLALIPVAMAVLLNALARTYRRLDRGVPWYCWLPVGLVWFAFLPNACYLITEWRHFLFDRLPRFQTESGRMLLISVGRESFYFLLYSIAGVLCFALAIRPVERLVRRAGVRPLLLAAPFFLLVSLGVYLGLIVRLNSWDIAARPAHVARIAIEAVLDPVRLKAIMVFAALLFCLYEVCDIFFDGLQLRLRPADHTEASAGGCGAGGHGR